MSATLKEQLVLLRSCRDCRVLKWSELRLKPFLLFLHLIVCLVLFVVLVVKIHSRTKPWRAAVLLLWFLFDSWKVFCFEVMLRAGTALLVSNLLLRLKCFLRWLVKLDCKSTGLITFHMHTSLAVCMMYEWKHALPCSPFIFWFTFSIATSSSGCLNFWEFSLKCLELVYFFPWVMIFSLLLLTVTLALESLDIFSLMKPEHR